MAVLKTEKYTKTVYSNWTTVRSCTYKTDILLPVKDRLDCITSITCDTLISSDLIAAADIFLHLVDSSFTSLLARGTKNSPSYSVNSF